MPPPQNNKPTFPFPPPFRFIKDALTSVSKQDGRRKMTLQEKWAYENNPRDNRFETPTGSLEDAAFADSAAAGVATPPKTTPEKQAPPKTPTKKKVVSPSPKKPPAKASRPSVKKSLHRPPKKANTEPTKGRKKPLPKKKAVASNNAKSPPPSSKNQQAKKAVIAKKSEKVKFKSPSECIPKKSPPLHTPNKASLIGSLKDAISKILQAKTRRTPGSKNLLFFTRHQQVLPAATSLLKLVAESHHPS